MRKKGRRRRTNFLANTSFPAPPLHPPLSLFLDKIPLPHLPSRKLFIIILMQSAPLFFFPPPTIPFLNFAQLALIAFQYLQVYLYGTVLSCTRTERGKSPIYFGQYLLYSTVQSALDSQQAFLIINRFDAYSMKKCNLFVKCILI